MSRLSREERAKQRQRELDIAFGDIAPEEDINEESTSTDKVEVVIEAETPQVEPKKDPYAVQAALAIREQNQALVSAENFWDVINPDNLAAQISHAKAFEDQFDAPKPPPEKDDGESTWRKDK